MLPSHRHREPTAEGAGPDPRSPQDGLTRPVPGWRGQGCRRRTALGPATLTLLQVISGSSLQKGDAGREEDPLLWPADGRLPPRPLPVALPALGLLLSLGPHLHLLGTALLGMLQPLLCTHPAHHGHLGQELQVLGHGGGCRPGGLLGAPDGGARGPGWARGVGQLSGLAPSGACPRRGSLAEARCTLPLARLGQEAPGGAQTQAETHGVGGQLSLFPRALAARAGPLPGVRVHSLG